MITAQNLRITYSTKIHNLVSKINLNQKRRISNSWKIDSTNKYEDWLLTRRDKMIFPKLLRNKNMIMNSSVTMKTTWRTPYLNLFIRKKLKITS